VTPDEVRSATFRHTVGRAYYPPDVDDLLARVAIQLEAHQSPATTIEQTKLHTRYGGYEPADVDLLLDRLRGAEETAWNSAAPRHYKPARSAVWLRLSMFGILGTALLGSLGWRNLHGTARTSSAGVAVVGLAGLVVWDLWSDYQKLTSEVPVDDSFDSYGFIIDLFIVIIGLAFIVGGSGVTSVRGGRSGFSPGALAAGIAFCGFGVLGIAANVRDALSRGRQSDRART